MRPATLRFARLGLPGALSFNRRGHAYEPTYAVVDVLDAERDERLGTIVNVGVHPVVLGPDNHAVSSDWVGVCRREVERRLGGTALFVQGCQGDVDPLGMSWTGDGPAPSHDVAFAAVERVGEDFALAAVAAAVVATPVVSTGVGDGDGDGGGGGVGATVRVLDVPCAGSPMARIAGRDSVRVELHEWSIGGVRIVAVPGEGFAELATRVLAARAGVPTIVCGLAPHWLGYLPVPFGDGYEEGLSYGEDAVGAIVRALEAVPQMGAAEAGGGGAGR
jgi:hypothetical protein